MVRSYNGSAKFLEDIIAYTDKKNLKDKLITLEDFSIAFNTFGNVIYTSRVIELFEFCVYENNKAVVKQVREKLNLNILLSIFKAFDNCLKTLMLFKLYTLLDYLKTKDIPVNTLVK
jgi:hypothetical protein